MDLIDAPTAAEHSLLVKASKILLSLGASVNLTQPPEVSVTVISEARGGGIRRPGREKR